MYIEIQLIPHKAVAQVSRIGYVKERLIVVSDQCHSNNIDQMTHWLTD